MADTQRAPRVEACIQEAMEKYAGGSPGRDLTYYQNVHQDLAPLARELENALSVAKARIAELERATPPSPSTAPEAGERSLNESIDTPEFYETVSSWKENSPDAALWSDVISKINDYARREVAAALASRPAEVDDEGFPEVLFDGNAVYGEITRKLGKSHRHSHVTVSETLDAVVRLLRAAPSHTPNKEKNDE